MKKKTRYISILTLIVIPLLISFSTVIFEYFCISPIAKSRNESSVNKSSTEKKTFSKLIENPFIESKNPSRAKYCINSLLKIEEKDVGIFIYDEKGDEMSIEYSSKLINVLRSKGKIPLLLKEGEIEAYEGNIILGKIEKTFKNIDEINNKENTISDLNLVSCEITIDYQLKRNHTNEIISACSIITTGIDNTQKAAEKSALEKALEIWSI